MHVGRAFGVRARRRQWAALSIRACNLLPAKRRIAGAGSKNSAGLQLVGGQQVGAALQHPPGG